MTDFLDDSIYEDNNDSKSIKKQKNNNKKDFNIVKIGIIGLFGIGVVVIAGGIISSILNKPENKTVNNTIISTQDSTTENQTLDIILPSDDITETQTNGESTTLSVQSSEEVYGKYEEYINDGYTNSLGSFQFYLYDLDKTSKLLNIRSHTIKDIRVDIVYFLTETTGEGKKYISYKETSVNVPQSCTHLATVLACDDFETDNLTDIECLYKAYPYIPVKNVFINIERQRDKTIVTSDSSEEHTISFYIYGDNGEEITLYDTDDYTINKNNQIVLNTSRNVFIKSIDF